MTDTLNSDLMLAILAMDACNRGYNASIDLNDIRTIGSASVSFDSSYKFTPESTRDGGFYAVSYTWDGKTVISYRGTDNQSVFAKPDKGASDIWSGWTMGAGYAGASQAVWAEKFYKEVTGQSIYADSAPSNVLLTGHSLGGGLAGDVGSGEQSLIVAISCNLVREPVFCGDDGLIRSRRRSRGRRSDFGRNHPSCSRRMMPTDVGGCERR